MTQVKTCAYAMWQSNALLLMRCEDAAERDDLEHHVRQKGMVADHDHTDRNLGRVLTSSFTLSEGQLTCIGIKVPR